jgi:hypothetical protein
MTAEVAADRVRRKLALLRAKRVERPRWIRDLADHCHAIGARVEADRASRSERR